MVAAVESMSKFLQKVPGECNKNVKEAIKQTGLDWAVSLQPLFTASRQQMLDCGLSENTVDGFNKSYSKTLNRFATVRMDNGKILGCVGKNYKPLQNINSFDFFQPFLDSGECELESAGCLYGGIKTILVAKINRPDIDMGNGDYIQKRIMLFNSNDGTSSVKTGFVCRRIVCFNQMPMINRSKDNSIIRLRHCNDIHTNLSNVRNIINTADSTFVSTAAQYKKLQNCSINKDDIVKYVKLIIEVEENNISTRTQNKIDELVDYCITSPGVDGKSLYSVLNGITYYTSNKYGRNDENRFDSLNFGVGLSLNDRALMVLNNISI